MNNLSSQSEITIRPAIAADQDSIKHIIREAGISPMHLDWAHFLLAEANGQIVATGQIKPLKDGTLELASIATILAYQNQGIASKIIWALLAQAPEPLYLVCESKMASFYPHFGFRELAPAEMPTELFKRQRLISWLIPIINTLSRTKMRLLVMKQMIPPDAENHGVGSKAPSVK
ncbi:MAG: GNAT family N-acetyltransferase [Chloroflexota bacterium]